MTESTTTSSRRAGRRAATVQEIKTLAMQQIATAGVEGLSLNALARSMGTVPAALYRYFAGKDALLAELVVDAYDELADALEAAAARRATPRARLSHVTRATREWALGHPQAYRLVFQHTSGSGQHLDADRTLAAAQRSMDVLLAALAPLHPAPLVPGRALAEQLRGWGARSGVPDLSVEVLAAGLACWYRLHGLISLELGGHLPATGVDPALLYEAEVAALVTGGGSHPS